MLQNISILNQALDVSVLRHNTISNNLANMDTPNYKPQKVVFEEVLKGELANSSFEGTRSNTKHIPIGNSQARPFITEESVVTQNNGNGVDVDKEMSDLTENSIWYQTLSYQLSEEFNLLKTAIKSR
ncbi:flagellar basal body rod protein FlgB [Neobacillus cucumis]|uniref:Flagellar basal body rod protein FlgB n=1 Tax=Neobacillus cucumis TaxID=1740721 RepID=A0A2N5H7G1_9BACI|nr:flagellar basal body rod protein FlgB [Neobacillus cucumis]PLS01456.1 flagellar basal body rod protein FlgB [Neobacillus cucumis]